MPPVPACDFPGSLRAGGGGGGWGWPSVAGVSCSWCWREEARPQRREVLPVRPPGSLMTPCADTEGVRVVFQLPVVSAPLMHRLTQNSEELRRLLGGAQRILTRFSFTSRFSPETHHLVSHPSVLRPAWWSG